MNKVLTQALQPFRCPKLWFVVGLIVGAGLVFEYVKLNEPDSYMISWQEDSAAIVGNFKTRGDCLVELERENLTTRTYNLVCWTKPNE